MEEIYGNPVIGGQAIPRGEQVNIMTLAPMLPAKVSAATEIQASDAVRDISLCIIVLSGFIHDFHSLLLGLFDVLCDLWSS